MTNGIEYLTGGIENTDTNAHVHSALSGAGIDTDTVWATPDEVWHIGEGDDIIHLADEGDDETGQYWAAADHDGNRIAEGDLTAIAEDVAARVAAR